MLAESAVYGIRRETAPPLALFWRVGGRGMH